MAEQSLNRVIHRSGLSTNLPKSAPKNELLFIEDTRKIYKGNGVDKPLLDFSDVITGFADIDDLSIINPAIKGKLYLTDNGILAYYDGDSYIPVSGTGSGAITDSAEIKKMFDEVNIKIDEISQTAGATIIKEVSNPLTTEPLEYGTFVCQSITDGVLGFDVKDGNMTIESNGIKLKHNTLYKFDMSIKAISSAGGGHTFSIKNKKDNSVIDKFEALVINNTANAIYSNSISAFVTVADDSDFYIETYKTTYTNVDIRLVIQEVRNNPVNQYGGFETEVLFEGKISSSGEYTLSDLVENYNLFIVQNTPGDNLLYSLPPMTSDTTPSPLSVTASNIYSSEYQIWQAFNQRNNGVLDCWLALGTNGWVQIDTGGQTVASHVFLASRSDGASVKDIIIQGSDNLSSWETLASITGVLPSDGVVIKFEKTVSYRYYKLTFSNCLTWSALSRFDLMIEQLTVKNSIVTKDSNAHSIIYNGTKSSIFSMTGDKINVVRVDSPINKIIGVKGQLPSLLGGGEF